RDSFVDRETHAPNGTATLVEKNGASRERMHPSVRKRCFDAEHPLLLRLSPADLQLATVHADLRCDIEASPASLLPAFGRSLLFSRLFRGVARGLRLNAFVDGILDCHVSPARLVAIDQRAVALQLLLCVRQLLLELGACGR